MNNLFFLFLINLHHSIKQKSTYVAFLSFCFFLVFLNFSTLAQTIEIDSLSVTNVDSTWKSRVEETPKDSIKTVTLQDDKLQVELEPKFKLRPPTRAALLSAVLPGAGQFYNKKGWAIRVPIIYAALTTFSYLSIQNHANYRIFRENYLYKQDENPATKEYESFVNRSADQIKRQRDSYRRDRDFYMIVTGIIYLLNIGEATTTAHFNNFDIDDDISFKFKPQMENIGINGNTLGGLSLVMTF